MRYIKPGYYDKFVCIAGECPATCCAGWQIVIDEESLQKYGNVKGDFGRRLRNSIDWMEERLPELPRPLLWHMAVNTGDTGSETKKQPVRLDSQNLSAGPRSVIVLTGCEFCTL